jgi:hypothetical protein
MIILAAAFLILSLVWIGRRAARRIRRALKARSHNGGTTPSETTGPPREPSEQPSRPAPDDGVDLSTPEEPAAEPQGPRLWGDPPGAERAAAGDKGGG